MPQEPVSLFWFRRDLRLIDNAGLFHALRSGLPVLPVFIFDTEILDKLEQRNDARVAYIHKTVAALKTDLIQRGSDLLVMHGKPEQVFKELLNDYPVKQLFTNRDDEPYALKRDKNIAALAASMGCSFHSFKDQCIFEREDVLKDDGTPYTVFTPYARKWKALLKADHLKPFPSEKGFSNLMKIERTQPLLLLKDLGFEQNRLAFPSVEVSDELIQRYNVQRDFPAIDGTSRLGIHLRFGTISIRAAVARAMQLNETFLNELIWREFYKMVLYHFPKVGEGHAFRAPYEKIQWRNNEEEFRLWCEGLTGYPIVDAGLRELNATGFMHNRVRMIAASFLSKQLLIDWRWGEAYFASRLLDFDLSANNGGWQWAAGCGTDAAPYFRIFNPYVQTKKFDHEGVYIRKWVPEWDTLAYPRPIVDHEFARQRCLQAYKAALA